MFVPEFLHASYTNVLNCDKSSKVIPTAFVVLSTFDSRLFNQPFAISTSSAVETKK